MRNNITNSTSLPPAFLARDPDDILKHYRHAFCLKPNLPVWFKPKKTKRKKTTLPISVRFLLFILVVILHLLFVEACDVTQRSKE
jgi:hypothetical protein